MFETSELFEEVPGAHSSEKIQLPQVIKISSGSRGSSNQREVEPSHVNPLVFRAKNRGHDKHGRDYDQRLGIFYGVL